MPKVQDFKKGKKEAAPKRRPGRDPEVVAQEQLEMDVELAAAEAEAQAEEAAAKAEARAEAAVAKAEAEAELAAAKAEKAAMEAEEQAMKAEEAALEAEKQATSNQESPQIDPYESTFEEDMATQNQSEEEKVHLDFYGSEILRVKAPKVMEVADEVADQWVKDGDFEAIPVGHPLAQMAVAKGLRKAKDIEKKLEEKGVFAAAKMGLMYAEYELKKRGLWKK